MLARIAIAGPVFLLHPSPFMVSPYRVPAIRTTQKAAHVDDGFGIVLVVLLAAMMWFFAHQVP